MEGHHARVRRDCDRSSQRRDRELLVTLAGAEPGRHAPVHRNRAVDTLDPANQLEPRQQPAVIERDRVCDAHLSGFGRECRAQDVAVADVLACRLELGVGGELEGSATPCVEQACEHGLAVEARKCKPVDRAVTCNERARPPVADRRVILDRNIVVSVAHARIRSQGDRV